MNVKTAVVIISSWIFLNANFVLFSNVPRNIALSGIELNMSNIEKYSAFWPYNVRLTEAAAVEAGKSSLAYFPGVLQRIEDGKAIIDFGRDGIQTVDVEKTDILGNAVKIKNNPETKELSNLVRSMANQFLYKHKDAGYINYVMERDRSFDSLLLVYCDERFVKNGVVRQFVGQADVKLLDSRCRLIFVPFSYDFYDFYFLYDDLSWLILKPHLVGAYQYGFCHRTEEEDHLLLVWTDPDGKVLDRWEGDYSNPIELIKKAMTAVERSK